MRPNLRVFGMAWQPSCRWLFFRLGRPSGFTRLLCSALLFRYRCRCCSAFAASTQSLPFAVDGWFCGFKQSVHLPGGLVLLALSIHLITPLQYFLWYLPLVALAVVLQPTLSPWRCGTALAVWLAAQVRCLTSVGLWHPVSSRTCL